MVALEARGSRVTRRGEHQVMAQCPAHEDGTPSLSVRATESRVRVHCFAGCDDVAVLDALGLAVRDLYESKRGDLARYRYTDSFGHPLRTVHRGPDKSFRQTKQHPKGPVLYRLPQVRDAVLAGAEVYLVEGEEDVHSIEAAGAVATTAPQGASSFAKVDVTPLTNAWVVVVADQDPAGARWLTAVRKRLDGVVKRLEVRTPLTGKDVDDHLTRGRTLDELVLVAGGSAVPGTVPVPGTGGEQGEVVDLLAGLRTGDWLDRQTFPPLLYAVPGIIPEGFTLLVGPPKIGKSWCVLGLMLAVAAGGKALDALAVGTARPVLYLALEDGDRRLQDRARVITGGGPLPANFHYLTRCEPAVVMATVREWMDAHAETGSVICLDTLGKVMPPALPGESAYARDYRVGGALKRLVDDHPGSALLVNHHDRKAGSADFVDSVSGTHGLAGAADTILHLSRDRNTTTGLLKVTGRDVVEAEYALTTKEGRWSLDGDTLVKAAEKAVVTAASIGVGDRSVDVIAHVAAQGPRGARASEVEALLGKDARKNLQRLVNAGKLDRKARGIYVLPPLSRESHVPSEPDPALGTWDTWDGGVEGVEDE